MSENGKLAASELAPIPGGQLANDGAAASWNAGPAKAGLRPLGPNSSYRTYATQQEYWAMYQNGTGNLAAYPGESNHGWGHAVDLEDPSWMQDWIIEHGHAYGWFWGEASSEPWHVTWDSSSGWTGKPVWVPLKKGSHGPRVERLQKLLRHAGKALPKSKPYRYWPLGLRFTGNFGSLTRRRVIRFQKDHGLHPDGICGEKTWKKLRAIGRKK